MKSPSPGGPSPCSPLVAPCLALFAGLAVQSASFAAKLTGVEKTAHFEIHFRPGSHAEASVDRTVCVAEEDLQRILRELELKEFKHVIRLYLYDDVHELQELTGVGSGGHSTTLESHIPYDNDQTRLHELVHVVAEQFSEKGNEERNLFAAEGLANAVLRFVWGVPVDAVAAFYLQRKELPPLSELMAGDFYKWLEQHPGFNAYDVAGSFFRYLLDTYGAPKVRKYYKGQSAHDAFGADIEALERGWHERLAGMKLRPGLEALLRERLVHETAADKNPAEAKLDDKILGPASRWKKMDGAAIASGDPGAWESAGVLRVSGEKSQGDWSVARLGKEPLGDAFVRCRAEPLAGCFGVQIQLGIRCQAMVLRDQGAFLYNERSAVAHDAKTSLADKPVEIVLRRQAGKASVWVDGVLVAEGDVDGAPADLGLGSVGGKARFTLIAVEKL
jgi:hypothetical protein